MGLKNISTLVKDIYEVLETGRAKLDAVRLGEMIASRLAPGEGGPALRMSNLGEKCWRKLWYRQNQPSTAEPLLGPTLLKFNQGDVAEEMILSLSEQAGHTVEGRQDAVELHGVVGHIDAIIDGILVDVKSANSRGMDKFKNHTLETEDPFGYLTQLSAYAEALKDDPRLKIKKEVAFLAFDKELGHLVLDRYKVKQVDWPKKIAELRDMLAEETPPKRAYIPKPDGASGNMQIPMECSYCQFKTECYKDSNNGRGLRKFIYSTGPRWLTSVMREPNVPEVQETIRARLGSDSERQVS